MRVLLASSLLPRRFLFAQIRLQNDRQHLRLLRDLQTAPGLRREHQLPIGRPEHHVLHRGPRIPPQLRAGTHGRVWSRYPPWRIWSVVPPTVGDHIRRCGVLCAVCGVLCAVCCIPYAVCCARCTIANTQTPLSLSPSSPSFNGLRSMYKEASWKPCVKHDWEVPEGRR